MVTISEIRGSDVGSLNGLGQTKSGTVFGEAEGNGYPKVLRIGVKQPKEQVAQLQMLLSQLGYNVPVTGVFDTATDLAVKALQEKVGVQGKPNGVYDQNVDELVQDKIAHGQTEYLRPTTKEAQKVNAAAATVAPGTMTVSPGPGSAIQQSQSSGAMTPSGGGFFANLMNAAKQNPALFAAGAVAVIAAFIFVPKLLAQFKAGPKTLSPVQVMGLGDGPKKRKRRSKKKA